jgi:hypothetical protein
MIALSAVHLIGFGTIALDVMPEWLRGELWMNGLAPIPNVEGLFWASIASFAVPLLVIGLLVCWLAKTGIAVPRFVPLVLGGWLLICSLLLEPSGFPIGFIPVFLLLRK